MGSLDGFNVNDGSFLAGVFMHADDDTTHLRVAEVLDLFGLPNPQEREYHYGDHASSIHLTEEGLTIRVAQRRKIPFFDSLMSRIGHKNRPTVFNGLTAVHENVLQPLDKMHLTSDCVFEVLPTVARVGVKQDVAKAIGKKLRKDGIDFYDPEGQYVGLVRDPETGTEQEVIVNRSVIRVKGGYENDGRHAPLQEKLFRPLREQLQDVFTSASGARATAFLKRCAAIVALPENDPERVLHPTWLDMTHRTEHRVAIAEKAKAYQKRLRLERH